MAPQRAAPAEVQVAGPAQVGQLLGLVRARPFAAGLTFVAAVAVIGAGVGLTLFFADFLRTARLDRQEWANLPGWLRTL